MPVIFLLVSEAWCLAEDPRSDGEVVGEPNYIVEEVHRGTGLETQKYNFIKWKQQYMLTLAEQEQN